MSSTTPVSHPEEVTTTANTTTPSTTTTPTTPAPKLSENLDLLPSYGRCQRIVQLPTTIAQDLVSDILDLTPRKDHLTMLRHLAYSALLLKSTRPANRATLTGDRLLKILELSSVLTKVNLAMKADSLYSDAFLTQVDRWARAMVVVELEKIRVRREKAAFHKRALRDITDIVR